MTEAVETVTRRTRTRITVADRLRAVDAQIERYQARIDALMQKRMACVADARAEAQELLTMAGDLPTLNSEAVPDVEPPVAAPRLVRSVGATPPRRSPNDAPF